MVIFLVSETIKNGGTSESNKIPHVMWSRFSKTKNNGDVLEGLNGTTWR